jgi:ABC-2 type transport system permease protein
VARTGLSQLLGGATCYAWLVRARLSAQAQYRASWLMALVGSIAINAAEFAALAILFTRLPRVAGWSVYEVALLYGLSSLSFACAEMLGSGLDDFDVRIQLGTFDRVLCRPRSAFLQVLGEDLALRRAGRVAQALIVLVLAQAWLGLVWTPDRVAVLVLGLLGGTIIYFAIFVLGAAFCFWSVQGKEVTNAISYGGDALACYPLDVFATWLRRFVTFVLPLAFVSYQPALYLLGRPDPLGLPSWLRLLSPLAAAAMAVLACWAWTAGVRHYQSTGT